MERTSIALAILLLWAVRLAPAYDCCASLAHQHSVVVDILEWATKENIITPAQQQQIIEMYMLRIKQLDIVQEQQVSSANNVNIANMWLGKALYYVGAVALLLGMILFIFYCWNILGGGGILTTSLVYLAILLWASRYLWSDIEYQIIGGLFSCFAVCTIPIATYGLLRQLNLWKSEEDFSHTQLYTAQGLRLNHVIIKATTIVLGFVILYFRPFPISLVPISVAILMLLMDAVKFVTDKKGLDLEEHLNITAIFGAVVLVIAFALEESTSDFPFWLHLIGSLAFCIGVLPQREKQDLSRETFYLCAHVLLLYFGGRYHRTTLTIFGAIGVIAYFEYNLFQYRKCIATHTALYTRAVISMVLLALSLFRQQRQEGGDIEYILGVLGFMVYNITWVKTAGTANELIYLLHLLTNIGIMSCAALFKGHAISMYLFSFDGTVPLIAVGVLGIIENSTLAFYFEIEFKYRNVYCWYRVAVGVFLSGLTRALPRNPYGLVWAGVVSIVEYTWMALAWKLPDLRKSYSILPGHFLATLIAASLSALFDITSLILLSVGMMLYVQIQAWKYFRTSYMLCSAVLVPVAILLDSKLILLLGSALLIGGTVRLCNSILPKPISKVLTVVLILSAATLAILYQQNAAEIRQTLLQTTRIGPLFSSIVSFFVWLGTASETSWLSPVAWIGWPAVGVKALSEDIQFLPLCLTTFVWVSLLSSISTYIFTDDPVDEQAPAKLTLTEFQISFPRDTDGHGLVFAFKGTKPANFTIDSATLYFEGEQLWDALEDLIGAARLNTLKSAYYPIKLLPNRMSKSFFKVGTDSVEGYIQLCTGEKGEPRVAQTTIRTMLRKLVPNGDPPIQMKVIYSSRKAIPKKGVLFAVTLPPSKVLNTIRENIDIKDVIANRWNK